VAGSALAAGGADKICDSTEPNGPRTNRPSYGPEAYSFKSLGDQITFGGTARSLSSVTVTLSSWACEQGTWDGKDCSTATGATFAQPITLTIRDAEKTVPRRPVRQPQADAARRNYRSRPLGRRSKKIGLRRLHARRAVQGEQRELSWTKDHLWGPARTKRGPHSRFGT
jgi:hypothetical protein